MLIYPIKYTDYSFKKHNKSQPQTNINNPVKKDSPSFGITLTPVIEKMPPIEGLEQLSESVFKMKINDELSFVQIKKLEEIYKKVMPIVDQHLNDNDADRFVCITAKDQNPTRPSINYSASQRLLEAVYNYKSTNVLRICFKDGNSYALTDVFGGLRKKSAVFEQNKLSGIY